MSFRAIVLSIGVLLKFGGIAVAAVMVEVGLCVTAIGLAIVTTALWQWSRSSDD